MDIPIEKLREVCGVWQERLRLRDWNVDLNYCRATDMSDKHIGGCIHYNFQQHWANVQIVGEQHYDPALYMQPFDPERILVHELLHLHFAPFDAKWLSISLRMAS